MKKIALISSYCDTVEKLEVLKENLNILKLNNVDTFVISNLKIDIDCDYFFLTKENPILSWPERSITSWRILEHEKYKVQIESSLDDYGWASLYQIKKIMEIALTYDYDIFYVMLYDLEIDQIIIDYLKSDEINVIFPRKDFNTDKIYPSSLHFSIFNKEKLHTMSKLIDKNTYLQINDGFAEDFVHQSVISLGLNHSSHVVTDSIQAVNFDSTFNHSTNENYKIFFSKNDENFKFLIYDFDEQLNVSINDKNFIINPKFELVETDIPCGDIYKISITSKNTHINYIDLYNKKSRCNIHLMN